MEMDRAQCSQMLRRRRFKQLIFIGIAQWKNHIYILSNLLHRGRKHSCELDHQDTVIKQKSIVVDHLESELYSTQ